MLFHSKKRERIHREAGSHVFSPHVEEQKKDHEAVLERALKETFYSFVWLSDHFLMPRSVKEYIYYI